MSRPKEPFLYCGVPVRTSVHNKAARLAHRRMKKYGFDPDRRYDLSASAEQPIAGQLPFRIVREGPGYPIAPDGVLIGTIRMGYGHYRIAMAAASAALSMGATPYWVDFLGFDTPGARLLADLDKWYRLGSKLSQQWKTFNKWVWEPAFSEFYKPIEKTYSVYRQCEAFTDLCKSLPEGMPFLATHPWTGTARMMSRRGPVVNMVHDNHPMGFHLVEGSVHAVQSPASYHRFRIFQTMAPVGGLEPGEIFDAGHFVDSELVDNAEHDCELRLSRAMKRQPRRFLMSVGGAGAQLPVFIEMLRFLLPRALDGKAALLINIGDHGHFHDVFDRKIPGLRKDATIHTDWAEIASFAESALKGRVEGVHLFHEEDAYRAVYATNLLMRCTDFLVTKPSELAFYPVPKVFQAHVGGHEKWSAVRSAEIGDGTVECNALPDLLRMLDTVIEGDDILKIQCDSISNNVRAGVYDGAKRAVARALEEGKKYRGG